MSLRALMDYTFTAKYSRYLPDKKRRETWKESVDRVRAMMLEKYADKNIEEKINWAYDMMYKKRVLGSQRALQFGGEPIFKHHARIYNCLDKSTKFITSHGVRSFNDFSDGDSIDVLTHTGKWQQATVKQYGEAYLNKITLQKGNAEYIVYATDNHRWILHNGEVTESLKINDRIYKPEDTFNEFIFESSSIEEQLYWCYGYVYGDGTMNNNYSMVRLCGNDASYEHRFTNLGFKSSSSLSLKGDVMVYTGKYQKIAPDPKIDNPLLIRAFVAGYLAADGTKSTNTNGSKYINIQSSDVDHINFIRECFPIAGVWIISEKDLTGEKTNFGIRPYTVSFRISTSSGSKFNTGWKVKNIEKQYKKDTVWCLEVENDKSFILPCGIVTGNCVASYIDRLRFFQECMYLLLCGCGAGFSVQKHHIAKLPSLLSIAPDGNKKFVIEDDIEGWSDAIGVLVSSYFEQSELFPEYTGKVPVFDYSKIREKNAPLSNGGKAPGPEPLRKALKNIKKILDNAIARVEFNSSACRKLKPIEAYDIVMHFADAVISGGVRRSATICVFSPDDEEMAKAKTGNWFIENPQRGRSNNSALLLRDKTTPEQFAELMKSVKEFGEPGFVWSDSTELIVNPCVTIDTKILTVNGWKQIGDLLGQDVDIYQDNRVSGGINEHGEFWNVDMSLPNECVINRATNVRKTGINRDVYELELSCGRTVKATDNHHFATPEGMVELKDLSTEDYLLIPMPPVANISKLSKDFNIGYLYGLIFGDGCFTDNAARINMWGDSDLDYIENSVSDIISSLASNNVSHNANSNPKFSSVSGKVYGNLEKHTLQSSLLARAFENFGLKNSKDNISFVHEKSKDFKAGFVSGLFYADGHSEYSESSKSISLRITSINRPVLKDVQLLLQELGVFSRINIAREAGIRTLPDSNRDKKEYNTQECYRLIIGGLENCFKAASILKLSQKHSNLILEKYNNRKGSKTNIFTSKVESITYLGKQDVYCLSEDNRRTMIVEGITSRRCVEIGMYPVDVETGLSGWQGCNLSTINCSKVNTPEDFYDACEAAAIIGTLQAGFTSFSYLGEVSERIFRRESLLGVSGTGWLEKPEICLNPEVQQRGAEIVKETNAVIAYAIDIPVAARTTCVKPEGSSSCVLGTASGIHPHHAKRYIRRVQANKSENVYRHFKNINPRACEESVWSANKTDDVISFCVEVPDGSKTKNQVYALNLLEIVKSTQRNWVIPGTNLNLCTQPWLNHNVSNTINVQEDEWQEVEEFIYNNRKYFCGISLLPATGDKDYPQAPFTTVYLPSEMLSHYGEGAMFASGLIEAALTLWNGNLWAACTDLLTNNIIVAEKQKINWIDRCNKYAGKYFNGDVKRLTYCMKDVYNYKLWTELQREYKPVDYTTLIESEDNTELEQALACSNGSCEIL